MSSATHLGADESVDRSAPFFLFCSFRVASYGIFVSFTSLLREQRYASVRVVAAEFTNVPVHDLRRGIDHVEEVLSCATLITSRHLECFRFSSCVTSFPASHHISHLNGECFREESRNHTLEKCNVNAAFR